MNIEMSKHEELSDSELDGVTGGGDGFFETVVCTISAGADKVRQVIHKLNVSPTRLRGAGPVKIGCAGPCRLSR